jgi:hypothetical protein
MGDTAGCCWPEGHLTRRLFGGMLRKIAALLSPADKASEKAEQIAMTTPERRERCWQNRGANRHFRPLHIC